MTKGDMIEVWDNSDFIDLYDILDTISVRMDHPPVIKECIEKLQNIRQQLSKSTLIYPIKDFKPHIDRLIQYISLN